MTKLFLKNRVTERQFLSSVQFQFHIGIIHFILVISYFSPLNGHTNYVKVIKDGGCWSQIGMVGGGEQELSLVGNLGGTIEIKYSK